MEVCGPAFVFPLALPSLTTVAMHVHGTSINYDKPKLVVWWMMLGNDQG